MPNMNNAEIIAAMSAAAGELDEAGFQNEPETVRLRQAIAALESQKQGTPAANWRVNGEPDPHGSRFDGERSELALGDLTDDELANAVFLHGNVTPSIADVINKKAKMPIVYLTAAKERIRWLSRKVEALEAQGAEPVGYTSKYSLIALADGHDGRLWRDEKPMFDIPLYAAPPAQAAAVPDWEHEAKRAFWCGLEIGAGMGAVPIAPRWDEYIEKRKGEINE